MAIMPLCIAQPGYNSLWIVGNEQDPFNLTMSGPGEVEVGFMPIERGMADFELRYDSYNYTTLEFGEVEPFYTYNMSLNIPSACVLVYSVNGNYSNPVFFYAQASESDQYANYPEGLSISDDSLTDENANYPEGYSTSNGGTIHILVG